MKLVSIVVPNYNCEEFLPKCLDSVTSQTYPNIEIIICDNGSSDRSVEIINEYAAKDSRIKVLINEVNQGLIKCYNRMFFEAKGDYIMIMDADDWSDVTRAEKQAAILDKYDVGLCVTDCYFHSSLEPSYRNPRNYNGVIEAKDDESWAPATIMFRRSILKDIPGFHPYFERITSYDRYFILDILARFKGYYLDEPLYHVWVRPNSDHRSIDLTEKRALTKLISQDIYDRLKAQRIETGTDFLMSNDTAGMAKLEQSMLRDRNYMADKIRKFACIQIDHGNLINAKDLLRTALTKAPFFLDNYRTLFYYLRARRKKQLHSH
ncbi:MAG TPA: glycosyltransferase family A protein [Flavipsychrobacter sp.]|jgi:glycosyltransferase involved in cell wall biosynthesis|nr:glycosyltransferase family A protein [Flavipsychrobacter sp.]